MVLRSLERSGPGQELFPCLRTSFETIARAKVSGSGLEARSLGFLRPGDAITMNSDHLIADAKRKVLTLVRQGFQKPDPPLAVPALGRPALSTLKIGMHQLLRGAYISPYDYHMGSQIGPYSLRGRQQQPEQRQRAALSGPGTRDLPQCLWRTQVAGPDPVHASARQAAAELKANHREETHERGCNRHRRQDSRREGPEGRLEAYPTRRPGCRCHLRKPSGALPD